MPLSEEDLGQVREIVNGTVNGVVAALKKSSDAQRTKDQEALGKLLEEKLSALKPQDPPGDGDGGKKNKGESVELATLRKQQADTTKQLEDIRKERDAERAKSRAAQKRSNVGEALSKHGIEGMRFRGAYAMIQERIRNREDNSDELVFVDDSGAEVDLDVGLASWAKTDEAKMFLPPIGASGSGARRAPTASGKPPEKKDVTYEDVGNAVLGMLSSSALDNPKLGG